MDIHAYTHYMRMISTHTHTYVSTYIHTYILTQVHAYKHTNIHIYTYIRGCRRTHMQADRQKDRETETD